MTEAPGHIRVATRKSPLALAQSGQIANRLGDAELVGVDTDNEPGDKERFVRGVELTVLNGRAELGVHSAKDLPGEMTGGLEIAAVPLREDARDVWIGPGTSLADIPQGSRVGTVSLRRRAQLLALRPDLVPVELRGNVDTRLAKLRAGEVDAIVLAMAGLKRLEREGEVSFAFGLDEMVPSAGQGALVVQSRSGNAASTGAPDLNDEDSERTLLAERAAVVGLGADCSSPVGIHARIENDRLRIDGFIGLADGSEWVRDRVDGELSRPEELGQELARRMALAGGADILARAQEGFDGPPV